MQRCYRWRDATRDRFPNTIAPCFHQSFCIKERAFFHDDCNRIMYASLLVRTTWNYLTCCLACSKLLFTNFSSMTKTYSSAVLRRSLQKHIWTNVHQNISFIGKHNLNHLPHVCYESCPNCIFLLLKQIMKIHVFSGWYAAWSRYEHQIVFCPAFHEWFFFLREKSRTWYRNVNGFVRCCADRCKSAIFFLG